MKINQELIEKLKNGHIAIDNQRNPNVELLRAVLKEAFPFCSWNAVGNCINYSKNRNDNDWTSVIVDLPTIPLNDFLEKEFVLPEKWCINVSNFIQGSYIVNNYSRGQDWYLRNHSNVNYFNYANKKNFDHWSSVKKENYKEITFEQFKEHVLKEKPMKEQFPKDDFGVIVENNNGREIIDYLVNTGFKNSYEYTGCNRNGEYYGIHKNSLEIYAFNISYAPTKLKTYTLQQLKNLENNMENKEIELYKLKFVEYCAAVEAITGFRVGTNRTIPASYKEQLEKAKVLNLWFEPVYKSKEVVIKMGNSFDLTIKDGKVWHKSDNITQFVQNLVNCFDYVNKDQSYGQYKAQFKDVIFSSTGCERTETKLSEWILVYNELQKQK